MDQQPEVNGQQTIALQFSLATMLILVAVAAVAIASITEMPEWLGAPILALLVVGSAAVVVTAAIRSRHYALVFYIGAAFPLSMGVLRTSLVMPALADGLVQSESMRQGMGGMGGMQLYGESYVTQRISYRWQAAAALTCAPLVGLVCVAFSRLANRERLASTEPAAPRSRRRWAAVLLTALIIAVALAGSFLVVRSLRLILPPDPTWDAHNGSPVSASGKWATVNDLKPGDRVLVEQGGTWWRGRVRRVSADYLFTIHYVGWESSFDETVPLSRLQIP